MSLDRPSPTPLPPSSREFDRLITQVVQDMETAEAVEAPPDHPEGARVRCVLPPAPPQC